MEIEQRISNIEKILQQVALNTKDVLNFDEACIYTGMSKSWLYKMTSTKQVPHYKNGKRCYFDRKELIDWLKSVRIKTENELRRQAQSYCIRKDDTL